MRYCAVLAVVLALSRAGAGVVEYLSGAELQCENSGQVAASLRFILESDESEIRTHMFPDYRGIPCWTLGEFLGRRFVPAEPGTTFGADPAAEIVKPAARRLVREFYVRLASGLESAPIR
ncbi:hypothetical protein GX411_03565 [Candidatus Fermentibacteria bacterium]|nr:hypothetical protein [Candidatus Fermentibacteria bacterium]